MYAVLKSSEVLYLGDDSKIAVEKFQAHLSDTPAPQLVQVKDMQEMADLVSRAAKAPDATTKPEAAVPQDDMFSDAAKALLDTLDDLGLNSENAGQFVNDIKTNSEKAIAEVRSLGIEAMKAVGDGFIEFGNLINKTSEEIK